MFRQSTVIHTTRRRPNGAVALLILTLFLTSTVAATHLARAAPADETETPVLTRAMVLASHRDTLEVSGANFTPGGRVFLAIHDRWGDPAREVRWTVASKAPLSINGVLDHALEVNAGGSVLETFNHGCGQPAIVRAFDQQSDRWSNLVDVNPHCNPGSPNRFD